MKHVHQQAWEDAVEAKTSGNIERYDSIAKMLAARGNTSLEFVLSCFFDDSRREIALDVAARMDEKQKKALLSRAVHQGLGHRYTGLCWRFIEALPRNWVAEHIEAAIRPLLADEDDDDAYRQILALLYEVNTELDKKVVQEGTESPNKHIREWVLESLAEDEDLEREKGIMN